jgi:two-component system, chemotaxis family, chemotaxis protein CheY
LIVPAALDLSLPIFIFLEDLLPRCLTKSQFLDDMAIDPGEYGANRKPLVRLNRERKHTVKLNVLIVDDSAAIRKILVRVLSQTDLPIEQVHEASDGMEALKILETSQVSLILSDINMPNMDGLQLLTNLRSTAGWDRLSVIMITTEGSQSRVLEAVQLGAKGYVRKPFTAEQIKEKVMACLNSPN